MEIVKTITKKYQILDVFNKPFMKWGIFRQTRERIGLSTNKLQHCFICNHKFTEDEYFYLSPVKYVGNMSLCEECAKKAIDQLEKEKESINK